MTTPVEPIQSSEPPRVRHSHDAYAINHPVIVHNRADIASLMRAHRISLAMTCEQVDAIAGWSDRYVTKMENGSSTTGGRRQGIHITPPTSDDPDDGRAYSGNIAASFMSEVWFEAMGVALVLMPAEMAEKIGAVPAPKRGE